MACSVFDSLNDHVDQLSSYGSKLVQCGFANDGNHVLITSSLMRKEITTLTHFHWFASKQRCDLKEFGRCQPICHQALVECFNRSSKLALRVGCIVKTSSQNYEKLRQFSTNISNAFYDVETAIWGILRQIVLYRSKEGESPVFSTVDGTYYLESQLQPQQLASKAAPTPAPRAQTFYSTPFISTPRSACCCCCNQASFV